MRNIRRVVRQPVLILAATVFCVIGRSSRAQTSDSDSLNLISNPSFELNGQPTLQSWVADTFLTAFVQDTPPGGGTWSLRIDPGWIPQEGYAQTYITGLSGISILELTVWIKSLNRWRGSATLGQWSKGEWVTNKRIDCDSASWTQISIVDTLSLLPTDTVAVHLSAGVTEVAFGEDLFDLVRLVSISPTVSVQETSGSNPAGFSLEQNYPNPFNPSTTIEYTVGGVRGQVSGVSVVRLIVYDALGRETVRLVDGVKHPGTYSVQFDGRKLASGVYFCRLTAGTFTQTTKLLLIR